MEERKRSGGDGGLAKHAGNAAALKEMLAAGSAEAMAEAATTVAVKMRARRRWQGAAAGWAVEGEPKRSGVVALRRARRGVHGPPCQLESAKS